MSGEVVFFGGPVDGTLRVVDGDPMDPPPSIDLLQAPDIDWEATKPQPPITLRYLREVNPSDDGPAWLYRFAPPA